MLAGLLMLVHTTLTAAGAGGVGGIVLVSTTGRDEPLATAVPRTGVQRMLWRLAIIATAASGVVHAVATPHHAEESLVLGVFFFVSACVQFLWCTLAVLAPTRSLLRWGAVVDVLLIVLWVVSRTVGLPGLLEGPEAVGSWDVAAKVWELVSLGCSAALLAGARRPRRDWANARQGEPWLVYSFLSVSAAALLVLSLSGPPS